MMPTNAIAALAAGFQALELFPTQQAGGIGMLKAIADSCPDVMFCPTSGITAATAPDFLALPNVVCFGGSWLTPLSLVERGDWEATTALARAASALLPTSPPPACRLAAEVLVGGSGSVSIGRSIVRPSPRRETHGTLRGIRSVGRVAAAPSFGSGWSCGRSATLRGL